MNSGLRKEYRVGTFPLPEMEGERKATCCPKIKAPAVDEKAEGQMSEHIFLPIICPQEAYCIPLRAAGLLTVCALPNVFKAFVKPAFTFC